MGYIGVHVKFTLASNVEFEAENMDEALMMLALHFIQQLQFRPKFILPDMPPIDAFGTLINNMPTIDVPETEGFIKVDFKTEYQAPDMMQ